MAPVGTPTPDGYSGGYYEDDPFGVPTSPGPYGPGSYPPTTPPSASSYPALSSFIRVGHSLWAWLFALFGGLLARYFYATREKKPQTPTQSAGG
jgi:hypothetical protein